MERHFSKIHYSVIRDNYGLIPRGELIYQQCIVASVSLVGFSLADVSLGALQGIIVFGIAWNTLHILRFLAS